MLLYAGSPQNRISGNAVAVRCLLGIPSVTMVVNLEGIDL